MKTIRNIISVTSMLAALVAHGQAESLAGHLGAHKAWNVAFVRDLQVDPALTANAILVQAYSDAEWKALLDTLGVSSEWLGRSENPMNTVFWFADSDSSETAIFKADLPGTYIGFGRCSERTIAIFFPRRPTALNSIFARYLSKEQLELHQFAQRHRKK